MKVYLASSWKNELWVKQVAQILRDEGIETDAFCDASSGRYVFSFDQIPNAAALDFKTALGRAEVRRAFAEDKKWIDWADAVVMLPPCGNSSHLEAGYAKGCGKQLYIFGDFHPGQFDVMYGFADRLFRIEELSDLIAVLKGPC